MVKEVNSAKPAAEAATPLRRVERVLSALRRGEIVRFIGAQNERLLVSAGETLDGDVLALASPRAAAGRLILSGARAHHLALSRSSEAVSIEAGKLSLGGLHSLVDPLASLDQAEALELSYTKAKPLELDALRLVKASRLLPAALIWADRGGKPQAGLDTLEVEQTDLRLYLDVHAARVSRVAEARVPLAVSEQTRVIAYRPGDGGKEHLAILIGQPMADKPVLLRLHSECFTGDLLGSLRCDCGEQLQGALKLIAAEGGGLLLYLAQEGRGIGLVNKLRAYRLQDFGADTLDANEYLGFDADERIYRPAAAILQELGFNKVRLLTNNPEKISGLQDCGIDVVDAVQHAFPANGHNELYLRTKIERFGHLISK